MMFAGLAPASLVDYPGHLATTLFLPGCNLRCGYCHNPTLVQGPPTGRPLSVREVLGFLAGRTRLIRHICVTGGEPTMHPELAAFLAACRERGFGIKLDTNGARPGAVVALLRGGLCDYVAMDVKTAWARYPEIGARDPGPYRESVAGIRALAPDYEFRTTVAPGLVGPVELRSIATALAGARRYVLQQFQAQGPLLEGRWSGVAPHDPELLRAWAAELRPYFQEPVAVRNVP